MRSFIAAIITILFVAAATYAAPPQDRAVPQDLLPDELQSAVIMPSPTATQQKVAGHLASVAGYVIVAHEGLQEAYTGAPGDVVFENDTIFTLKNSRCRLTTVDDNVITLGSDARISVDRVVLDAKKRTKDSLFNLIRGKAMFYALKLFKYRQADMTVKTLTAVTGIRGTKFGVEVKQENGSTASLRPLYLANLSETGWTRTAAIEPTKTVTVVYGFDGTVKVTSTVDGTSKVIGPGMMVQTSHKGMGDLRPTPPTLARKFQQDTKAPPPKTKSRSQKKQGEGGEQSKDTGTNGGGDDDDENSEDSEGSDDGTAGDGDDDENGDDSEDSDDSTVGNADDGENGDDSEGGDDGNSSSDDSSNDNDNGTADTGNDDSGAAEGGSSNNSNDIDDGTTDMGGNDSGAADDGMFGTAGDTTVVDDTTDTTYMDGGIPESTTDVTQAQSTSQTETEQSQENTTDSEPTPYGYGFLNGLLIEKEFDTTAGYYRNASLQNLNSTVAADGIYNSAIVGEMRMADDGVITYLKHNGYEVDSGLPIAIEGLGVLGQNEYMEWGRWRQLQLMSVTSKAWEFQYKDGFYVEGSYTSDSQMAALASSNLIITYAGSVAGRHWQSSDAWESGPFNATVNFNAGIITDFDLFLGGASHTAQVSNAQGVFTGGSSTFVIDYGTGIWKTDGVGAVYGDIRGTVYGPNGEDIGGVWVIKADTTNFAHGVFQGKGGATQAELDDQPTPYCYGFFSGALMEKDGDTSSGYYYTASMQNLESIATAEGQYNGTPVGEVQINDGVITYLKHNGYEVDSGLPVQLQSTLLGKNGFMEWGRWNQTLLMSVTSQSWEFKYADGFLVKGSYTSDSQMAALASSNLVATYTGTAAGRHMLSSDLITGPFNATVNFNSGSITDFDLSVSGSGHSAQITDAQGSFTGSTSSFTLNPAAGTWQVDGVIADYKRANGAVYGPDGEEIGGIWAVKDTADSTNFAMGIFQGKR